MWRFGKEDAPATDIALSDTDENGNFALLEDAPASQTMVRLVHRTMEQPSPTPVRSNQGLVYFPLVRKGTEAESGL